MKKEQYKEIDKMLDTLEDPNFVAFANGGFQMQGVCGFLLQKQEQGERFQGVVVSHGVKLNAQDCAVLDPNDVRFVYNFPTVSGGVINKFKAWQTPKEEDRKTFYLIFVSKMHIDEALIVHLQNKYKIKRIQIIITSEGTQNYFGETPTAMGYFYARKVYGYPKKAIQFLRGYLVTQYKGVLLNHLTAAGRGYSCSFLTKENGQGIKPVDPERTYLRLAFEKTSAAKGIQIPENYYKNVVLFCAQHFIEEDDLCDLEGNLLKECQGILQGLGYRIMVKPHPADKHQDRFKQIGLELDEIGQNTAIEYLLAAAAEKPAALLSYGSTSFITGNLLWGVPAIALEKMIDIKSIDPHMALLFSNIVNAFRQIQTPKNDTELKKCLQNLGATII